MNRKQLIYDVFAGRKPERVPVGFWFHFLPVSEFMEQGVEHPEVVRHSLDGHLRYIKEHRPDLVKVMTEGYFCYPPLDHLDLTDIRNLKDIQPIGPDHPWIQGQVAQTKKLAAAIQGEEALFYNVFSPAMLLQMAGFSKGLGILKPVDYAEQDPVLLKKVLDVMAEDSATLARLVIREGGADGIYFCSRNFSTAECFRTYFVESEKKVLDAANTVGSHNILHICGYSDNKNDLTLYQDYPVQAVNWAVTIEGIQLGEGKKLFPGKVVMGGFSNHPDGLLMTGTRREIEEYTRALLAESGTQQVILGADCAVPDEIPWERLEWVRRAAQRVSIAESERQ